MSQSTARANRKAETNGTPPAIEQPQTYDLGPLPVDEVSLIYNMVQQGQFPTPEAKRAAASIQTKLEALLPRE